MSQESETALQSMFDAIEKMVEGMLDMENSFLALEKTDREDSAPMEATVLKELQDLINRLRLMDSFLIKDLKKLTPDRSKPIIELPDGGTMELRTGAPRKTWDKDALASIVVEKIMQESIDPDTGVIDRPISQMLLRVLDFVSYSSFKVTALRDVGVDPDNYCEKGPMSTTVQFRR